MGEIATPCFARFAKPNSIGGDRAGGAEDGGGGGEAIGGRGVREDEPHPQPFPFPMGRRFLLTNK
jgi:hypothetical protein